MLARIIGFLTENWVLKLAAVGLAILLWMAVTANEPRVVTFRAIPIEIDLRDPDWRLEGTVPPAVAVTVQGPRDELVDLTRDPPRIVFPMEGVSDTVEAQVVGLQWVRLPATVREARVLRVRPDTVRIRYQRLEARTLPVRVRTTGELPEGLALALPINTNPAAVEVRGPGDVLARLDSVPLRPVDVSSLTSNTNVPARVDTAGMDGLTFDPLEVNVVLRVAPADSQGVLLSDSVRTRAPY